MIYLPGYGLYPRGWLQRASKVRFQGQANRELLEAENMGCVNGDHRTAAGGPDMNDVSTEVRIPMLVTGPTLKELLLDKVPALGGEYRPVAGEWRFFIDPVVRVKLGLAGLPAPCSVKAEPLVCLRAPPPLPTLGGFMHPGVGVYCRPAGIPEGLLHRYRAVLSRASVFGMADAPQAGATPQAAATRLNQVLGVGTKSQPRWWLYTLPRVGARGEPEVAVGVAGDVAMDRTLPDVFEGVKLVQEIAYPKQGMGSAPIDTVWPTDSPDYHEPTGPGTGDDDPAIGDVEANPYNALCPTCGRPAIGATRCIPGSYFCANRHEWTPVLEEKNHMNNNGVFVTMSDLVSSGLSKQDASWGDDGVVESMPKGAGTILMGEKTERWSPALDVTREINGELVQSMPAGSATMDADPYYDNDMADLFSSRPGVPPSKADMAIAIGGMLVGGVAGAWIADKKVDKRPTSLVGLGLATVGAGLGLAAVKVGQRLLAQ